MKISDYLSTGKGNGINRRHLAKLVNTDERSLRRAISEERRAGVPIVADCKNGYFLPGNANELRRFKLQMEHRAAEIIAVARAAEDALARMENQEQISGWRDELL